MEVSVTYFISRLPFDFLISSLFIFSTVGISLLFLTFYEAINPIKNFYNVVLLFAQRVLLLFSVIFFYSSFLSYHQFIIPLLDTRSMLMLSGISFLMSMQINFYLIFFFPKGKGKEFFVSNIFFTLGALWIYFHTPSEMASYIFFLLIYAVNLIVNVYLSIDITTHKIQLFVHAFLNLGLILAFMFRVGYITGYVVYDPLLRLFNEYSGILFAIETFFYFMYFTFSDKSIIYVFNKDIDTGRTRNNISISKNVIAQKRFQLW